MKSLSQAVSTHTGTDGSVSATDRPPIDLAEHDQSEPLDLSGKDQSFLEELAADGGPVNATYTRDGKPRVSTSSYIGVAALPSGRRLNVTPKQTVSRLLTLLQYALDVSSTTVDKETSFSGAETFIDAFGALFTAKLRQLLTRGIRRDYTRIESIETAVRGRLDVQRQLQRPTPVPTDFAVEYDTLTANTTANQAILAATQILTRLVEGDTLAAALSRQATQLRQTVEPAHVTPAEIEAIETTRLNAYYADLLELSRLVVQRRFFEDLTAGAVASFGLFINMNTVYEAVVERAVRVGAAQINPDYTVEGKGSLGDLIDGPHAVGMEPDAVVLDGEGCVIAVADAKWKTGGDSSGDVYQLTSYMLAEEVPGLLVYPQQDATERQSMVQGEHVLRSVYLPTAADVSSATEYIEKLEEEAVTQLRAIIDDG
jgi:5-methylcytosine-specific restriction enzyme subunit McrC